MWKTKSINIKLSAWFPLNAASRATTSNDSALPEHSTTPLHASKEHSRKNDHTKSQRTSPTALAKDSLFPLFYHLHHRYHLSEKAFMLTLCCYHAARHLQVAPYRWLTPSAISSGLSPPNHGGCPRRHPSSISAICATGGTIIRALKPLPVQHFKRPTCPIHQ